MNSAEDRLREIGRYIHERRDMFEKISDKASEEEQEGPTWADHWLWLEGYWTAMDDMASLFAPEDLADTPQKTGFDVAARQAESLKAASKARSDACRATDPLAMEVDRQGCATVFKFKDQSAAVKELWQRAREKEEGYDE